MNAFFEIAQSTPPAPLQPKADVPWYQFSAREQAQIEFEARKAEFERQTEAYKNYRASWIKNLTDEQVKSIFRVFRTRIKNLDPNLSPYSHSAAKDIAKIGTLLTNKQEETLSKRAYVTYDKGIELFELFNFGFFTAKADFEDDNMTLKPGYDRDGLMEKWFTKVTYALNYREGKGTSVQLSDFFTAEVKAETRAYDYSKDVVSLPESLSSSILMLQLSVEEKLTWNLDGQTLHSLSNIFGEYIPVMVKSYIDIRNTKNRDNLVKIHESISEQLAILEDFVSRIESEITNTSISGMLLQEQFIKDKFKNSELS